MRELLVHRPLARIGLSTMLAVTLAACGTNPVVAGDQGGGFKPGGSAGAAGSSAGGGSGVPDFNPDGNPPGPEDNDYVLSPQNPVVTVTEGQPLPTLQFSVTRGTQNVGALWLLDRGELGAVDTTGLFSASGTVAGVANVEATVGTEKLTTTVTVKVVAKQNGSPALTEKPGDGGYGGVGGEGAGPAVDAALETLLTGTPTADPDLKWLYPYDATVFPTGLLAPLLQWGAGVSAVAEGVYIHLYGDDFDYKGTFGRPPVQLPDGTPLLAAGASFVRHPIPQDIWEKATRSAAGGSLTVELVVAAGGVAYGPIKQTWTIANGPLKGTVYYQSYGTSLAKNLSGAVGGDGRFGGATLAISASSPFPRLVAGTDGGHEACRVCHTVSQDGSRMIVQHGDAYSSSSSYDLNNGFTETSYGPSTTGQLGWIGMYPDGSIGVKNGANIPGGANSGDTGLFDLATGDPMASTGLNDFVTQTGFPAFSPAGDKIAFNFFAGPGDGTLGPGDGTQLVVMDFDSSTATFSNPRSLYQGANRPGWPSFLPTGDAVAFSAELPGTSESFATRNGGRGELWWADLATGTAVPLERANGTEGGTQYLPTAPNNHQSDSTLNYEPTVSPVVSGGYAWLVFVSRRLYGNVATLDPYTSDPRSYDHTTNPTCKKLWVAAIDLNAPPGTDPSHPAFYIPGQELFAGNSRGFWVLDPCKPDGDACDSGDECCGGFCQGDPETGELTCGQTSHECSNEFDKCTVDADCCDADLRCINERCGRTTPG